MPSKAQRQYYRDFGRENMAAFRDERDAKRITFLLEV
jgi:hypothetical protein